MMTQSEVFCELRKRKGLSQERVAEQLGVSRQTVSKWETGEAVPRGENLRRLSLLYGIPMEQLLEGKLPEDPPDPAPGPEPPAARDPGPPARKHRRYAMLLGAVLLVVTITAAVCWFAVKRSAPDDNLVPAGQVQHEEVVIPSTPPLPLLPLE